jgi:hypothetical protein
MKRKAGAMVLLTALSGCVNTEPCDPSSGACGPGSFMSGAQLPFSSPPAPTGPCVVHNGARMFNGDPRFVGGSGEPMMAMAQSHAPETTPQTMARDTIAQGLPPGILEQIDRNVPRGGLMQASASMPGGMPMGGLMQAGGPPMMGPPGMAPPGAVAAVGALTGGPGGAPFPIQRTSVRFVGPSGMKISWYGPTADGSPGFGKESYLTAPGRYNFLQGAIYRLKLTDIPQRQALDLYPTLEVVPVNAKTATFLAHSSVPVSITEDDINQVAAGNFVVKVIYLPDPQYQDLAVTGAEEIVSSVLGPGADPIAEACHKGSILLILRLGNILLELPNTPPMDAPGPFGARPMMPGMMPPGMMAGMPMPPGMMPGANGPVPPFGLTGNPRQMPGQPGMMPPGMMPPGMMPPGMMPPGTMPPGKTPQGVAPQGVAPQNRVPMGMMPQGVLPPDLMPRSGSATATEGQPSGPQVGQMLPPLGSSVPTAAGLTIQSGK